MRFRVRFDAPGEHPALATFVPRKADTGQYAPRRAPAGRIKLALEAAEKSRPGLAPSIRNESRCRRG